MRGWWGGGGVGCSSVFRSNDAYPSTQEAFKESVDNFNSAIRTVARDILMEGFAVDAPAAAASAAAGGEVRSRAMCVCMQGEEGGAGGWYEACVGQTDVSCNGMHRRLRRRLSSSPR